MGKHWAHYLTFSFITRLFLNTVWRIVTLHVVRARLLDYGTLLALCCTSTRINCSTKQLQQFCYKSRESMRALHEFLNIMRRSWYHSHRTSVRYRIWVPLRAEIMQNHACLFHMTYARSYCIPIKGDCKWDYRRLLYSWQNCAVFIDQTWNTFLLFSVTASLQVNRLSHAWICAHISASDRDP